MFPRSKLHFVAAFGVLVLGWLLDGPRASAVPALCDNLCRMRQEHQFCSSLNCRRFLFYTCILCEPSQPKVCVDRGDHSSLLPDCLLPVFGDSGNIADFFDACTALCRCQGDIQAVEAEMTGEKVGEVTISKYICRLGP